MQPNQSENAYKIEQAIKQAFLQVLPPQWRYFDTQDGKTFRSHYFPLQTVEEYGCTRETFPHHLFNVMRGLNEGKLLRPRIDYKCYYDSYENDMVIEIPGSRFNALAARAAEIQSHQVTSPTR